MKKNETAEAENAAPNAQHPGSSKRRFPFTTARAVIALAVAAIAILGGALHLGAGIPCAIGVEQIAAICPVGALEVMLGSKEIMLHPLVLLGIAVIIILIAGKAFCSWVCPVPWVKRLFKGKKAGDAVVSAAQAHASDNGSQVRASGGDSQALGGDVSRARELNGDSQVRVGAEPAPPARLQQIAATDEPLVISDPQQVPATTTNTADPALSIANELDAVCSSHRSRTCSGCAGCEALKAVGGKRDGVQVDSRHIVLLGALGSAAVFGFPVLCLVCPVGLTFAFLIGLANMFQFNEPTLALLVAPAILVLEVVFLRKWCTKLCPISALVSLVSAGNKTFKPKVDESKCLRGKGVDCHACVEACPEQLDPHTKMIPECSKCGTCVTTCPAHAISIKALSLK